MQIFVKTPVSIYGKYKYVGSGSPSPLWNANLRQDSTDHISALQLRGGMQILVESRYIPRYFHHSQASFPIDDIQ